MAGGSSGSATGGCIFGYVPCVHAPKCIPMPNLFSPVLGFSQKESESQHCLVKVKAYLQLWC